MIDLKLALHVLKYIGTEVFIVNSLDDSGFMRIKSIDVETNGVTLKFENSNVAIFKKWNELQGFVPMQKECLVVLSDLEPLSINDIVRYTAKPESVTLGYLQEGAKIDKRVVSFTDKYAMLDDGSRVRRNGNLEFMSMYYKIQRLRKIENNVNHNSKQ